MLKAWFKGCLVEILALRDYFSCFKTTLNVVLWPGCGRFHGPVVAGFMARFVKCPWHAQSMV